MEIIATGYGNNGENEGLRVQIRTDNEKIAGLFERIRVPHITISVSETREPVNTSELVFEDIPWFSLSGVFGVDIGNEVIFSAEEL